VNECVFCKIIAGQLPVASLLETDQVLAFLDIRPVNPAHTLVVPKRHVENLLQLTEEELHGCICTAQRLAGAIMEVTKSPGLNLLQNNHECAGQLVRHVHFHLIPRRPDDGFSLGWRQQEYRQGELEQTQQQIKAML